MFSFSPWWTVGILIVLYILIPTFLYLVTPPELTEDDINRRRRAIVLVLGDLARSPRMNYHALSLAKGGLDVYFCGYTENQLSDEIVNNERITVYNIPQIVNTGNLPFLLFAIRKVVMQHYMLYTLLKQLKGAEYLIVQNPPSIPVLGMSRFFVLFMSQRTRLVIDWHNFGYSILALKLGRRHPFVYIHKAYEMIFGRIAYCHLTVSVAMARFLQDGFKMTARRIIPLHDRPGDQFAPLNNNQRKKVINKHPDLFHDMQQDEKIVITSTSYTPDENLYTLLNALDRYKGKSALRVIITGKGPMYNEMKKEIESRTNEWKNVKVKQSWLSNEDYPRVLAVADIGVSLHESSSGIDLPMKVVDMFGCGVPVIALRFAAIEELVQMNKNGVLVDGEETLGDALTTVFNNEAFLHNIKREAMKETQLRWDNNWNTKIGPLFGIGLYPEHTPENSDSSDSE